MHLFHFNRFLNAIVMILLRNNRSIIPPPNVTCKSGFPSDALIPYCIVNYDSYGKSPVSLSDKESQGYLGAYIRTLEITYAFARIRNCTLMAITEKLQVFSVSLLIVMIWQINKK